MKETIRILIAKWLLFASFKWLPRYKAKRRPLSSASHTFLYKFSRV